tara:strand:+ start:222 stop:887 length:666 start_codon:yes stop_codon:yes gene_type:complete
MSDNEIFEIEEDNAKVFIPKSKNKANTNKKKAKAGMTEERKAKLLEQLARGRATSALNRAKKAKAKKIKKQDELTEQDEIIYKDIEKKKNKKSKREIELEDELNALKKKTKPLKSIAEEDDDLFSEGSDMEVILTEDPAPKQHVKIRFNEKTKRLADSENSSDDEEIEKQIQKLQAKKKNKKSKNQSSSSVQKPIEKSKPVDIQPVMNKKPKAWEVAHLWK